MPKKQVPLQQLQDYLPPGTADAVLAYLHQYKVHLTITRRRKSILGDYRHQTGFNNHRISINGNLNPWAFLVTMLHELAHLLTFEKYSNRVPAHGAEWKQLFRTLLESFLRNRIFPTDLETELNRILVNPAASSCAEDGLVRILRKYDPVENSFILVEELEELSLFRLPDGRVFIKGEKLRKRYKCREVQTGKWYLFSPVYEVEKMGKTG